MHPFHFFYQESKMEIEEVRRQLFEMSPFEQFLKAGYEVSHDASLSGMERRRKLHHLLVDFQKRIRAGEIRPSMNLSRSMLEYMETADDRFWDPNTPTEQSALHETQGKFGLTGSRHVRLSPHGRYIDGYMHDHEFIEMVYVFKGEVVHRFELDGMETCSYMKPGSVLIIPPWQKHEVQLYTDSVMLNILMRTDTFAQNFLTMLPDQNEIHDFFSRVVSSEYTPGFILIHTDGEPRMEELLLSMAAEQEEDAAFADEISDNQLRIFFFYLMRYQNGIESPGIAADDRRALSFSVRLFIETNYADISTTEVQEHYHFSSAYLNRVFSKHTGRTIKQYILETRMKNAMDLVQKTTLPIAEVARMTGYEEPSYFIASFRKSYGKTPMQARREG